MNNGERLYQAIGEADDELLERMEQAMEAGQAGHSDLKKRRRIWQTSVVSLLVAAAALLLIFNESLFNPGADPTYTASGPVIDRAIGNEPSSIAVTPGNGEIQYFESVRQAFETNTNPQTQYFVAIDLFAHAMPLEVNTAETVAELKRLQGLGLHVGYADAWVYQGAGEQVVHPYVAGLLTADQLKNFPASSEYGYAFRFATNGNGTPVSAENGIRIEAENTAE